MSSRPPKHDSVKAGEELGNAARNERQKHFFLAEVGRIRREQLGAAIENAKQALERSHQLCSKQKKRPPAKGEVPGLGSDALGWKRRGRSS